MSRGPGWDAITDAFADRYPSSRVLTVSPDEKTNKLPCKQIAIWEIDDPPHYHLVSYGLTELSEKTWSDPARSGWGHELTLRMPRTSDADRPPSWTMQLLPWLVSGTYETRHPFAPGHYCGLEPSLREAPALAGVSFVTDPSFPEPLSTPHGSVSFLQVVGLLAPELEAFLRADGEQVLSALRAADPLLITRLDRAPVASGDSGEGGRVVLKLPRSAHIWEMRLVEHDDGTCELSMPYSSRERLAELIEGNLAGGLTMAIGSADLRVVFGPWTTNRWRRRGAEFRIALTPDGVAEFVAAMRSTSPGAHAIQGLDGLVFRFTAGTP